MIFTAEDLWTQARNLGVRTRGSRPGDPWFLDDLIISASAVADLKRRKEMLEALRGNAQNLFDQQQERP